MKFRILQKEVTRFYIQYKRKYWLWCNIYDYGNKIKRKVDTRYSQDFEVYYDNYKSAKEHQDRLIKYTMEHMSKRRRIPVVHDLVDMDKNEVFVRSI
jgi:hypothetical protein|tara:strand:+ start:1826 stop:2116 length:291 start_codon:yes stop_codon:yes gene_type:complete